ncbi:uncharacterized protein V6R79_026157 [Siganus canaliculatus]
MFALLAVAESEGTAICEPVRLLSQEITEGKTYVQWQPETLEEGDWQPFHLHTHTNTCVKKSLKQIFRRSPGHNHSRFITHQGLLMHFYVSIADPISMLRLMPLTQPPYFEPLLTTLQPNFLITHFLQGTTVIVIKFNQNGRRAAEVVDGTAPALSRHMSAFNAELKRPASAAYLFISCLQTGKKSATVSPCILPLCLCSSPLLFLPAAARRHPPPSFSFLYFVSGRQRVSRCQTENGKHDDEDAKLLSCTFSLLCFTEYYNVRFYS